MRIGILALQGDVSEHMRALSSLGAETVLVKDVSSLSGIDGLVIPGGESTAMALLLQRSGMVEKLRRLIRMGMPVYGTCAGAILLAKRTEGQFSLGAIDITVSRNAYGSQLESFEGLVRTTDGRMMRGIFIRAPKITHIGSEVETVARHDGAPVAVRQGNVLCSTFHPELSNDLSIHRLFLRMTQR